MSRNAPAATLPAVPTDVATFAAEHGVADYVAPLLEMTCGIFPGVPMTVRLEDDMEIADLRWIVVSVDVAGWDADRLFAAQQQWTASLFKHCPSTHVHFFVLGMWASA